jgi:hypothetical protein
MNPDTHGPNTIDINGAAMLLTTTGGGTAVHLTRVADNPRDGREAVPDFYFDAEDRIPAYYDRAALLKPQWSETTLCGRQWAVMVGGDGGAVGRYGQTAFAPSCRRCLALIDRHFPQPEPDDRLALVAQLAADIVLNRHGYAEIHGVPGDQQDQLRKAVRIRIRQRTGFTVRTHMINGVHPCRHGRAYREVRGFCTSEVPRRRMGIGCHPTLRWHVESRSGTAERTPTDDVRLGKVRRTSYFYVIGRALACQGVGIVLGT